MAEGGGSAILPVIFYDGEKEIDIGNVRIYPKIEYKAFQSTISKKIGISVNQITIYIVEGRKSKFSSVDHRKILITGKTNFSKIVLEDSFFFVVLRRSRTNRRRKKQSSGYLTENSFLRSQWPENMYLLRRNQPDLSNFSNFSNLQLCGLGLSYYNQTAQPELVSYEDQLQNLLVSAENYNRLVSYPVIENGYVDTSRLGFPVIRKYWCKDCYDESLPDVFHICVNDPIAVGFRSPAGVIAPPIKPVTRSFSVYCLFD